MKKQFILLSIMAMALAACNGDKKSKGFFPKSDKTTLSESEREEALEAKRNALLPISVDSLVAAHGVKFSVLAPAVTQNVPQAASDKLASKLIQITSQNGIGGLCTNPVLALVARVDCVDRSVTGTAPQKAIVKYEVTFYCGNLITNDIYASTTQSIMGVGSNLDDAASKAMNALQNNADMQKMLAKASERAISWYSNVGNVKRVVDQAVGKQNYALASAILSSVPEQASATYAYAVKRNEEVSQQLFDEKADELLANMQGAISEARGEYVPEIGAYFKLIPRRSKAYTEAQKAYAAYVKQVDDVRKDKLARERAIEDEERRNAHIEKMEELAVEKVKASFEGEATIAQIKADGRVAEAAADNTGGFLGLGKLWDGSFNFANRIMDKLDSNW